MLGNLVLFVVAVPFFRLQQVSPLVDFNPDIDDAAAPVIMLLSSQMLAER